MAERLIDPAELEEQLRNLEVEPVDSDTTGYVQTDADFNLNAIAIGFGLKDVQYDPTLFPGLVYNPEAVSATVIIFVNGVITVVDAPDRTTVKEAIRFYTQADT